MEFLITLYSTLLKRVVSNADSECANRPLFCQKATFVPEDGGRAAVELEAPVKNCENYVIEITDGIQRACGGQEKRGRRKESGSPLRWRGHRNPIVGSAVFLALHSSPSKLYSTSGTVALRGGWQLISFPHRPRTGQKVDRDAGTSSQRNTRLSTHSEHDTDAY